MAQSPNNSNIGPILAATSCQFKKPLFYPGNITIKTRVNFIKTTSFSLQHIVLNDNGEIAAQAEDVIVAFNFTKNEKIQIPPALLEAIEKTEKSK